MASGTLAKYRQNPWLRNYLLKTGSKTLGEASLSDTL